MAGYRFWLHGSLSLVAALLIAQTGRTQSHFGSSPAQSAKSADGGASTCKVYALGELSDDPNLGKWLADTIPEMIQAGSWNQGGAKISYFAPGKVLVINHSSAVHAKVDEFLRNVRKSLPQKATAARTRNDPSVVPAQFAVPDRAEPMPMPMSQSGYPVASPLRVPKHLFHFIIRYEGDGLIDSNVVEFMKSYGKETSYNQRWEASPASSNLDGVGRPTVTVVPASGTSSQPTLPTVQYPSNPLPPAYSPMGSPSRMPSADEPPPPQGLPGGGAFR